MTVWKVGEDFPKDSMTNKARMFHEKAVAAREKEQFSESLTHIHKALHAYSESNDLAGFSEGIAFRAGTLKVYADIHNNVPILLLAKHELEAASALAEYSENANSLSLTLYTLAQVLESLNEYASAVQNYKKASSILKKNSLNSKSTQALQATMQLHLETCKYKTGDTAALGRAEKALKELTETNDPNEYTTHVWISGGYLRIANALKKDDLLQAKRYLLRAKEYLEAHPELVVRKKQYELLEKNINRVLP